MLSKNKIKFLQSLWQKKKRDELSLFIVEGERSINEILSSDIVIETIIGTGTQIKAFEGKAIECVEATFDEMKKVSLHQVPQGLIAVCQQVKNQLPTPCDIKNELVVVLDCIQDPGNMGTIIRLASWFGIKHIVCSADTVDCYNPKVVQSTMGAISKVKVHYTDLIMFISVAKDAGIPIYGAFLDGENLYEAELGLSGILVMGNEGNGIGIDVERLVTHRITIPNYSLEQSNVESLNVAIATSILCAEFRRRIKAQ